MYTAGYIKVVVRGPNFKISTCQLVRMTEVAGLCMHGYVTGYVNSIYLTHFIKPQTQSIN